MKRNKNYTIIAGDNAETAKLGDNMARLECKGHCASLESQH